MNIGSETEQIEFKKSTGELNEGIVSIVAILNKHQAGELYFGVKNDGTVLGCYSWESQVSKYRLEDVNEEDLQAYLRKAQEANRITFEYIDKKVFWKRWDCWKEIACSMREQHCFANVG